MKTGIIFDMDGTLWDSAKEVADSWSEVLRKHANVQKQELTKEDLESVMGLTMKDIADRLFPEVPEDEQDQIMEECMVYENAYLREHGATVYEGVEETFQVLSKECPLYIVSNCQSGYIEAFLDYYDFHRYITDFACYGDNKETKDVNIRLLAERNHLERYIYVGDIQGDYEATMKAGGEFIHAAYGFGEVDADVIHLQDIRELPGALKK